MRKIAIKLLATATAAALALPCCACGAKSGNKDMLGVWWWDKTLAADTYLDFAAKNGVIEVYYCDTTFGKNTESFIGKCNNKKIDVYMLAGEYQWLSDPAPLYALVDRYVEFSEKTDVGFSGIHLDIEPHQDPNFNTDRATLVNSLISLTFELSDKYPDIKFDYDIPFWLDDEIAFDGKTLPAYAHIINNANRTFIMSYRDTAEAIYATAEDEIEFAESVGKTVVLGVETYSTEGDNVSFAEEGKKYMYSEMNKLREMLPGTGIAVHQIKTWYDLKD